MLSHCTFDVTNLTFSRFSCVIQKKVVPLCRFLAVNDFKYKKEYKNLDYGY